MLENWFDTLNESLDSEGLVEHWPLGLNLSYGEYKHVYFEKDKQQHVMSVYRSETGRYERPVWYNTHELAIHDEANW